MKKIGLIMLVVLSTQLYAQTNFDFETWSGIIPDGWESYNDYSSFGVPQTVFQITATPAEGTSSVMMENIYWAGGIAYGLDTLAGFIRQGFPYTQKPNKIHFQYIANPQPGDMNTIVVVSTKWNTSTNTQDQVGIGFLVFDTPTTTWQDTAVSISYTMPDTPDSMFIIAAASAAPIFGNGQGFGQTKIGSQFYLDSLVIDLTAPCVVQTLPYSQNDLCSSGNGVVGVFPIGMSPYTYTWSNGGTTDIITGLSAGTYSVTVEDANGCFGYETISITSTPPLYITTTSTDASSCSASDGSVTAMVSGGVTPYTYNWAALDGTPLGTTATVTGLPAGGYLVTVADAAGCIDGEGAVVNAVGGPVVAVSFTDVNCNGESSGTATAYVTGGTSPYNYSWGSLNNPLFSATGAAVSGLPAGDYIVTVTDANGCIGVNGGSIQEPTPLIANTSVTNVSTQGGNDGSVTAIVSGGTTPYVYMWSNGANTSMINNLTAGVYTVTVQDNNGCQTIAMATVTEPSIDCSTFNITVSATDVTTCGGSDGSASVAASGGTTPYSYVWQTLSGTLVGTTASVNNLTQGGYLVTVTDANNCIQTGGIGVNAANGPQVSVTSTSVTCAGANDGTATAVVSGGVTPYSYSWTALNNSTFAANTPTITGLASDIYVVTVTDANGCAGGDGDFVSEPPAITITLNITDVSVQGGSDGSITAAVSGGISPYVYQWSNGATTANISNLTAGNYTLQVTDNNGCMQSASGIVNEPGTTISCAGFGVTLTATDVSTQGGSDGSITAIVSGGTSPYAYMWSNGATTSNISGLTAGTYSVTITDVYGCVASDTVNVQDGSVATNTIIAFENKTYIYPNPAKNVLYVDVEGAINTGQYQVMNQLGEMVQKGILSNHNTINIEELPSGIYFLSITYNTDRQIFKINIIR